MTKKRKKKSSRKNLKKVLLAIAASLVALVLTLGLFCGRDIFGWFKPQGQDVTVEIPIGSSASQIATILEKNNLIKQPFTFRVYVKCTGQDKKMVSGTYVLHAGMSYSEMIYTMQDPSQNIGLVRLVVPEGYTLDEIAKRLETYKVCSGQDFLNAINDPEVYSEFSFASHLNKSELNKKYYPMEGYAFPATYTFLIGTNAKDVAKAMLRSTDRNVSPYFDEIEDSGMTLDQVITLASIVQAEAGKSEDMPKIASVLHNRLYNSKVYPYLECTPTQKYAQAVAAGLQQQGKSDDGLSTGYSTFETKGIPSGAICSPGKEAIEAVLNPADTQYYYFCSNLQTKETFYAETYDEHKQNLSKAGIQPQ